MNETLRYYDQYAEDFFNSTIDADMSVCRDKFLNYIPENGFILDAGCGSGRDSKVFMEKGYTVEAIDGSEKICKLASIYVGQKVKNVRFEEIEDEKKFDGIWACASLLHVAKNELPEIMSRFKRALKERGVLYASFKFGEGERIDNLRKFSDFTKETAVQLFENAGFLPLECFVSCDVRPDREDEKWVNIYGRVVE